ncbi:uncharacterized protein LOC141906926 isoform X2 [Tubulanus polymorphus]|uniref:uncharacterized protein LOC141906926 isoform X2 n=1 Tax=Tubulanus polymorphus TaxID=672921 RepID=UPI003DA3F998
MGAVLSICHQLTVMIPINPHGSGNWFWYNPCTAFTNKTCANVAVCQSLNRDYMIGVGNPPPSWTYDSSINRVIATYVGTGNTEVTLICTDSQSVQLKVTSAGVPVKLELSGSRVCAGSGSSDSLTVGSILCITFFVLVCVYLVAGVLFMHFVKRAEGTEKIPNKSMWGELTRLIYEGNIFVFGRFFKRGQYSQK